MNDKRVADLHKTIVQLDDKALLRASWWMARAEQLLPLIDAEIKKRGI